MRLPLRPLPLHSPVFLCLLALLGVTGEFMLPAPSQLLEQKPLYLPTFLPTPVNVTYHVGQEAVLRCAVENKGARTIVWRKTPQLNPLTIGDDTYIGDRRIKVVHQVHSLEWNLHIQDVEVRDAGVYECQVVARDRDVRQFVTLSVDETPVGKGYKAEIAIHGTLFVERGDTLQLVCNATGSEYPPDDIDWFKDGNKIKNSDRVTLSKDVSLSEGTIMSLLKVRRTTMRDGGTYVCRTSDLQVTSAKVNMLNTETHKNEKRESAGSTSRTSDKYGDNSNGNANMGGDNAGDMTTPSLHVTLTMAALISMWLFTLL
ncbi:cell adhesion molecule 2 [Aplysia californica]|uniref:Cell adhesion molecule 2 n=1 Tax=Aplysia californica TaxID=6500 RepID=A0ABM1A4D1_APLCA|nr:cell adhesion molecule 2 [Aplysia californica]